VLRTASRSRTSTGSSSTRARDRLASVSSQCSLSFGGFGSRPKESFERILPSGACRSAQSTRRGAVSACRGTGAGAVTDDGRQVHGPGGASAEGGGQAASAAGLGQSGGAGPGAAHRVRAVDRWEAATDGGAAACAAGGGGTRGRGHGRQGRGRRVEAAAPRGLRAADLSAGRSRSTSSRCWSTSMGGAARRGSF
jgi:hypothetical protein